MRTDIESRINEAEVCRSMGLYGDSLKIYESILLIVAPQDTQDPEKPGKDSLPLSGLYTLITTPSIYMLVFWLLMLLLALLLVRRDLVQDGIRSTSKAMASLFGINSMSSGHVRSTRKASKKRKVTLKSSPYQSWEKRRKR